MSALITTSTTAVRPPEEPLGPVPGDPTLVHITAGLVRGSLEHGTHVFRGIPYAAPPFGANHLRPPQPVQPWEGIRDATVWGPEPPQPKLPGTGDGMVWDPAVIGDDCLNLNVWTPDPAATGLPVFVWIPGGMFEVCSGATYDAARFARDGVVAVTINYRVNLEGFLFLDDAVPNRGLLDQIAALEWVRDNIAAFGGDPGKVTVAGESAGAMSIGTLLSMPRAEGLFRRAICQSGAAHRVMSAGDARRIGRELAARLSLPPTLEAIAAVDPADLLAAAIELKGDLMAHPDPHRWGLSAIASALPWQPVIDGEVIPSPPIDRIDAGASADVDVLVGSNVQDWLLFRVVSGEIGKVTEEVLTGPVEEHGYLTARAYDLPLERALPAYRAMHPGALPGLILAAIQTDWWCRIPAIRVAEAHTGGPGRTYMYEFAWPSPMFGGVIGACHALELPFVFDTLDHGPEQMLGGLLGPEPPQALATTMHGAWVEFAKMGDPGWPGYELTRRSTMRFADDSDVVDDPRATERALWAGVI